MCAERTAPAHADKRLARLAAVQALYRLSFGEEKAAEIVATMIDSSFDGLHDEAELKEGEVTIAPDTSLFSAIAMGAVQYRDQIDEMLKGALDAKLDGDRMERLLRAILRAGVFEIVYSPQIALAVIINDYVDVTRSFFDAREPGLVNAVLDRIGRTVRS